MKIGWPNANTMAVPVENKRMNYLWDFVFYISLDETSETTCKYSLSSTPAPTDGSQCSSSCSTVVVTYSRDKPKNQVISVVLFIPRSFMLLILQLLFLYKFVPRVAKRIVCYSCFKSKSQYEFQSGIGFQSYCSKFGHFRPYQLQLSGT